MKLNDTKTRFICAATRGLVPPYRDMKLPSIRPPRLPLRQPAVHQAMLAVIVGKSFRIFPGIGKLEWNI